MKLTLTLEEARSLTADGRKQNAEKARQELSKILSHTESYVRSVAMSGSSTCLVVIIAGDDVITTMRKMFQDAGFTVTIANREQSGGVPVTVSW